MSDLRTEEEQIELIKNWWADNGKAIIIAAVLAVAAIAGWKWWQADQQAKAQAASSAYEQLLDVVNKPELTEEERTTARHLADTLQTEYADTLYAKYAGLFEARLLAEQEQYDAAIAVLKTLQGKDSIAQVKEVAAVREAQILWQQDKNDQALALLDGLKTSLYTGNALELKGDILAGQGETEAARTAYEAAKAAFARSGVARSVIDMKLADLGA